MFGKSKLTLKNEIKYLELKNRRLEEDLESERRVVRGYEKRDREKCINASLESAAREEPIMIDFDKVEVWSIEREHANGKNITVVGVLQEVNGNKVSKDFRYNTNSDGHKRIIAAYEVHRAKKGKKS